MSEIGWREWVALPELGIQKIKAKIDTGARTSSLDAEVLELYEEKGIKKVRFRVQCGHGRRKQEILADAPVVDQREVTDSGGHTDNRLVIRSTVIIGKQSRDIEITLADRKGMKFRMLLGRTAINENYLVNTGASYLHGKPGQVTGQK